MTMYAPLFIAALESAIATLKRAKQIPINPVLQDSKFSSIYIENGKIYAQRDGHPATVVKAGKILPFCLLQEDHKYIEILAGYLSSEVKRLSSVDISRVKVSGKVSEIYMTKPSSLGRLRSCMQDRSPDNFKIYDDIDRCEIAYLLDSEGGLEARALLWYDVLLPKQNRTAVTFTWSNRVHIMDTIYYSNEVALQTLLEFAKQEGLYVKETQSLYCATFFEQKNGKTVELAGSRIYVDFQFEKGMYEKLPYIDTFYKVEKGTEYIECPDTKVENTADTAAIRVFDDSTFLTKKVEKITCPCCGREIYENDKRTKYGKKCCVYCEGRVRKCEICGKVSRDTYRVNGKIICGDIACSVEADKKKCPICGKEHRSNKNFVKVCTKINGQMKQTPRGRRYKVQNEYIDICPECFDTMRENGGIVHRCINNMIELYEKWEEQYREEGSVWMEEYYRKKKEECFVWLIV